MKDSTLQMSREEAQCEAIAQLDDSELLWAMHSLVFGGEIHDHLAQCSACRARYESLLMVCGESSAYRLRKKPKSEATGENRPSAYVA